MHATSPGSWVLLVAAICVTPALAAYLPVPRVVEDDVPCPPGFVVRHHEAIAAE